MKKLIIFDLDGTLLDTLDDLKGAVNYALESFGYEPRSREHVRKSIGNGVAKLIERCIPDGANNPQYPECLRIFKEYYSHHYNDFTVPYDGMVEVVSALKKQGYLLAVATNKIDALAQELIEKHYQNLFNFVLGDIDGVPKKPHPKMIENILKHFGLNKEDALYVGDTNVDEETALNSGLDYILLTYGYRTKEEILSSCKGRLLISSPQGILEYLKK